MRGVQVAAVLIVIALMVTGFGIAVHKYAREPDPNAVCAQHGGVDDVKLTGRNINFIICNDGYGKRD